MPTLAAPPAVESAGRRTIEAEVLAAAHRLGSTLSGLFATCEIVELTGLPQQTVWNARTRLAQQGRWPYPQAGIVPGEWRDTRPVVERLARDFTADSIADEKAPGWRPKGAKR